MALRLGRTVEELLRAMSYRELMEWREFYMLDPFDEQRADLRVAIQSALIANANRDRRRRSTPFTHLDFMPFREREQKMRQAARPPSVSAAGKTRARLDAKVLTFMFLRSGVTMPPQEE